MKTFIALLCLTLVLASQKSFTDEDNHEESVKLRVTAQDIPENQKRWGKCKGKKSKRKSDKYSCGPLCKCASGVKCIAFVQKCCNKDKNDRKGGARCGIGCSCHSDYYCAAGNKCKSKGTEGDYCSAAFPCASDYTCEESSQCRKKDYGNYKGGACTFTRWAAVFAHDSYYGFSGAESYLSTAARSQSTFPQTITYDRSEICPSQPEATLIKMYRSSDTTTMYASADLWSVVISGKTYLFVAWQGTQTYYVGDAVTNAQNDDHRMVWVSGSYKGAVQKGNYNEVNAHKSKIDSKIKSWISENGTPEKIVFTGHSQGGSQAEIHALWSALKTLKSYRSRIVFVTFNPTKSGNQKWADKYPSTIDMSNSYTYISWHQEKLIWGGKIGRRDTVWLRPVLGNWHHPKSVNKRYIECDKASYDAGFAATTCHTRMFKKLIWRQA